MQSIEILTLSGHSPFTISICDITNTYCYVVATGVITVPLTVNVPTQLLGVTELLVVVTDSEQCKTFLYKSCPTSTPTPTPTTTPTPTSPEVICNCLTFTNIGSSLSSFSYTNCDGVSNNFPIYSGTTLFVCGKLPIPGTNVIYTVGGICIDNSCPTIPPASTPTNTPTNTPTPSVTPTNTITPTVTQTPTTTQTPTNTPTPTPTNTTTPTPTSTPPCIPELIYSGENFTNLPLSNGSSFKSDGTVLYITIHNTAGGSPSDSVCAYSLSTPWDVSTITLPRIGCSIASPVSPSANYGQYFSPDGSNLFLANSSYNSIVKYTLSTPWDVTTSSYSPGDLFSGGTLISPSYLEFSPDGLFMFVTLFGGPLKKYSLTTPWVINTGVVEIQSISFNSFDFTFQNNGTYLFSLISSFGLTIRRQTLTTPYDLTSINPLLTQTENVSSFITGGNFFSITFKDGYKGFISGYYSAAPSRTEIYAFNLTCEWDISGIVILPTPTPTPTPTITPTPTDTGSYLLQGDGFFVLQGDGSKIIIL